MTMVGGFNRVFRENRDLLSFGGLWALAEIPGPNRPKNSDPPKIEKQVEQFIFRCGFKKFVLVENRAIFAFFFPFALGALF